MIIRYPIHEVSPYINWVYFYHAWGYKPHPKDEKDAESRQTLQADAIQMLNELDGQYQTYGLCELLPANADGDNLKFGDVVLPLLRQQSRHLNNEPFLCLSDFVRPIRSAIADTVGVFAASVDQEMEALYADDPYRHMLVQTLCDRLAEATTEKMHEYVRREVWGYAPDEQLSMEQLLNEDYQGIRPAVGYPSLPDQSVNFILDALIDFSRIGIRLTENGMMIPHASVSGLMLAHPASRYFAVGHIGEDQLADYARRRGMSVDVMRKYLVANL